MDGGRWTVVCGLWAVVVRVDIRDICVLTIPVLVELQIQYSRLLDCRYSRKLYGYDISTFCVADWMN